MAQLEFFFPFYTIFTNHCEEKLASNNIKLFHGKKALDKMIKRAVCFILTMAAIIHSLK